MGMIMMGTTTTGTTTTGTTTTGTTGTGTTTTGTTGTGTGGTGGTTTTTGTSTSTSTGTGSTTPDPVTVSLDWGMSDNGYVTEINVGDTVTWTMVGMSHTVTSTDSVESNVMTRDPMDSGFFGAGDSWSFTFTEAGTFTYRCDPHASMTGTVVVSD
jgi:plastocyanin